MPSSGARDPLVLLLNFRGPQFVEIMERCCCNNLECNSATPLTERHATTPDKPCALAAYCLPR